MKRDLTIVVTAHNEGLVAHKTMLSIFRAIKACPEDIKTHILVSLDRPDQATKEYFSRYNQDASITVLTVDFGGLSESRNNAAKVADSNYLTFIDADDLMSENWLHEGYKLARADNMCIVHPEYSITFGDDNLVWRKRDSRGDDFDKLCFIDNNLWDSPSMAPRKIYLDQPYFPNGSGFGYEDKQFHAETLATGIKHKVAPQTILFVRRKISGSMLRQSLSNLAVTAPTTLLDYDSIRRIAPVQTNSSAPIRKNSRVTHYAKSIAKKTHTYAKRYEQYNRFVEPIKQKYIQQRDSGIYSKFPDWLLAEWRAIHLIDNSIFPSKSLLESIPFYNSENTLPGQQYVELIQSFSNKPDTLFFVPWLIKGGADMLFINYSNELSKTHPDWHIAMLQTEDKDSLWKDQLAGDVDFINLFNMFLPLDYDTRLRLLATLITQNGIKRIIIGNSQLAYDFVSKYQTLIKRLDIAIYCYAFGEEFDDEGRLWGHIHTGIPKIYPVIHRVITDNKNTVDKLEREYGFNPNKFAVHYQPTALTTKPPIENNNKPLKILWASRVCKQKRPDILKAVAKKLNPKEYEIHAYGQLEEDFTEEFFNNTSISYKGAFNGMGSLPTSDYDIYLYTSEGDGVPNVLQEITASGLPIVASNVGGIREFIITNKTGALIDDHNNIDSYVDAISRLQDPNLRKDLVIGAQSLLNKQFSRSAWQKSILNDFDK